MTTSCSSGKRPVWLITLLNPLNILDGLLARLMRIWSRWKWSRCQVAESQTSHWRRNKWSGVKNQIWFPKYFQRVCTKYSLYSGFIHYSKPFKTWCVQAAVRLLHILGFWVLFFAICEDIIVVMVNSHWIFFPNIHVFLYP